MGDLNATLAGHREAIGDLIAAAERSGGGWAAPRAPGKWSPSQIVEHVVRSLDESANVVAGAPSKFPNLPFFRAAGGQRPCLQSGPSERRVSEGQDERGAEPGERVRDSL